MNFNDTEIQTPFRLITEMFYVTLASKFVVEIAENISNHNVSMYDTLCMVEMLFQKLIYFIL